MVVTDDLVQIVATTLWQKWEQFDTARPFRPWALGIARLEVLKWRQQLARSREVLSSEAVSRLAEVAADAAPEIDDRYGFLLECIESLNDESRELLGMKYGEGLKAARIAGRLGRRVEAVEMMLVRVRRALRDCIERKLARAGGEG
jgi:RNA polymerase sigma-70 factor (ECF subfamily)